MAYGDPYQVGQEYEDLIDDNEEVCPTCGKTRTFDMREGIWVCEDDWQHVEQNIKSSSKPLP